MPYTNYDDINIAIKLINKIQNDEVFNVDEYVESCKTPETTTTSSTNTTTKATTR